MAERIAVPPKRIRFLFYLLAAVVAVRSASACLQAYLSVPKVSDLYNLVYDNSRPKKTEGTGEFLLVMPAVTIVSLIATIVHVERSLVRDARGEQTFSAGGAMPSLLAVCICGLIGLERARVTCHFFGC